ncbi:MAG: ABC transporter substrate-binding protein [Clostridia bacterium]|nr:ABC transporter substrate-binding protein [Clostridia bacterium]
MKKFISFVAAACLTMGMFTGCGSTETNQSVSESNNAAEDMVTVGIGQFAPHGSLDNCVEGFKLGMAEAGYVEGENVTYDFQNAQADMANTNQIAQSMAANKVDLICGVATPMAQACYNAANGAIPVIYTAVTDPVAAQLANEDGTSTGNTTGTSDKLAVEAQLEMIRKFMPDAKKIGILYTTSEANSISAIAEYKELAPGYGFEIADSGISQTSDIPLAAADLAGKVDCISNLTDNTVVSALATVLDAADKAKIPVFGSEIEQVKNGCVAAEGLDYVALGKQTGAMAARVLKGEKAEDIPFETITEYSLYINSAALESLGMTCPEDLKATASEAE